MIWPKTFEQRLLAWSELRQECQALPVEQTLMHINSWWYQSPWVPYYLHWDDIRDWPDPWQLINENIFCDVARALGIMYTITMLDRSDITDACLVATENHNLVLVEQEKYILNWDSSTVVNNNFKSAKVLRSITQAALKNKLQ